MMLVSLRLPQNLLATIDKTAKKKRCTRSQLIREILETGLSDSQKSTADQFEKLREELLLAVGQVGDSVKELPRFIRGSADANGSDTRSSERLTSDDFTRPSDEQIRLEQNPSSEKPVGIIEESLIQSNPTSKPGLRPRKGVVWDPSQDEILEAEIVKSSAVKPATPREQNAETKDKRSIERRQTRSTNNLDGRPIGEERRQSIRIARVLVFKDWTAAFLAKRLKMPLDAIEAALDDRGDLASLKVEALLATWEDEMLSSNWTANGQISST